VKASTLLCSKIEGNVPGVFPRGAGPRGGLALCLAQPMVSSPVGGLTCHGVSPVMSKPSEGKTMDFESPGELGTGEED
jgi:hypothetical protein